MSEGFILLQLISLPCFLITRSYTSNCYDGDFKTNAIKLRNGEEEVSLLDSIVTEKKQFEANKLVNCPKNQDCFAYSVYATFTLLESKYEKEALETDSKDLYGTSGGLEIATQICLTSSIDTEKNLINFTLCDNWKREIGTFLEDMNILFMDLKLKCSKLTRCHDRCTNLPTEIEQGRIIGLSFLDINSLRLYVSC